MVQFEIKKHDRNSTVKMPFPFKLQEYLYNLEMLLLVTILSFPVLFDGFSTILDKTFVEFFTF